MSLDSKVFDLAPRSFLYNKAISHILNLIILYAFSKSSQNTLFSNKDGYT